MPAQHDEQPKEENLLLTLDGDDMNLCNPFIAADVTLFHDGCRPVLAEMMRLHSKNTIVPREEG